MTNTVDPTDSFDVQEQGPEHNVSQATPTRPKRPVTRRRLLAGIAGFAVAEAVIGCSTFWQASYRYMQSLWQEISGITLLTYRYHNASVNGVAWSLDGKRIASGSSDGSVRIWNARNGSTVFNLYVNNNNNNNNVSVNAIAWSPNGLWIASGDSDGTMQCWDVTTRSTIFQFASPNSSNSSVSDLKWSHNSSRLAFAINNMIQVISSTGQILLSYPKPVQKPDKRTGTIKTKSPVPTATPQAKSDHATPTSVSNVLLFNTVNSVDWSSDGKRIASGSDDTTVQIWDASTGKLIRAYRGHTSSVRAVAWSPDGKRIASGSDDTTVQIWDASTGKLMIHAYRGHTSSVYAVAWSPDGKRIASGSGDTTVQIWDASTGKPIYVYQGHTSSVYAVAWSPDGKSLVSGGADTTVLVWKAPK